MQEHERVAVERLSDFLESLTAKIFLSRDTREDLSRLLLSLVKLDKDIQNIEREKEVLKDNLAQCRSRIDSLVRDREEMFDMYCNLREKYQQLTKSPLAVEDCLKGTGE